MYLYFSCCVNVNFRTLPLTIIGIRELLISCFYAGQGFQSLIKFQHYLELQTSNGLRPFESIIDRSAPYYKSVFTVSKWLALAAMCSAVPSVVISFTVPISMQLISSTISLCPFFAAIVRGVSPQADLVERIAPSWMRQIRNQSWFAQAAS